MGKKKKIEQKIMLDVGCGYNKQHGYIGMDKRETPLVDVIHDAEQLPWFMFKNEGCSVVVMSHLIEHIKPWNQIEVINECWRVLDVGGLLLIATPYATSFGYFQDPTHCTPWNEATPEYFDPSKMLYDVYRPKPWAISSMVYDKKFNMEIAFKKITEAEGDKIQKLRRGEK